ncbi:hypothetical protein LJR289_003429 [Pseudoduganella sp. LjRoot289]|uniref:hypothetical protein n=1 Tax=Pseudoduganella sp. LjRoot289 TaxID=3342314 RepID=UPI003ECD2A09
METYVPKRRKFEQQTHSGTSTAGSMGAGATGDCIKGSASPGNSQSAGRTDDLLSGGVSEDQRTEGFQRDCKEDDLRKGLGGNRQ